MRAGGDLRQTPAAQHSVCSSIGAAQILAHDSRQANQHEKTPWDIGGQVRRRQGSLRRLGMSIETPALWVQS
jgi:hypothetical protein